MTTTLDHPSLTKNLWPTPTGPLLALRQFSEPLPTMTVIGGPCSWESAPQIDAVFDAIASHVTFIRGGLFRAGTYPRDKFGWEWELMKYVHDKAKKAGVPNVVQILDIRDFEKVDRYTEVFQVGMRDGQNYTLLKELGLQKKPVIFKIGSWMRYDETLGALEYILRGGQCPVFVCVRGSVSFHHHVRWELSLSMIAKLKQTTALPIIVDGAHGSGVAALVAPLTLAGIAAGADGFLAEAHPLPAQSLSDANQALTFDEFLDLTVKAQRLYDNVRPYYGG